MTDVLLVLSTFPDAETAARIAQTLVEEKLAACANILPAVRSIYRWQGKIEDAGEVLVYFKMTESAYPSLEQRLKELHPYEVPEIVALPLTHGLPEYLSWVDDSCA